MKDSMKDIVKDFETVMEKGESGIFFLTNDPMLKEKYEKLLGSSDVVIDNDFLEAFTNCTMVYYQKRNSDITLN